MMVNLNGVPAAMAYAWGIEAGCFMLEVRHGKAEGTHVIAAGNLAMIEMIAAEARMDVDVLDSENDYVLVNVKKRPHKLTVVRG